MRIKKFILMVSIAAVSTPLATHAQQHPFSGKTSGTLVDYEGCKYSSFVVDGGVPLAGLASGTPNEYFHGQLSDKQVRKLWGTLIVQIKIDTLGHGCCNRIQNMTTASDAEVQSLAIDQIIKQTAWQYTPPKSPARQPEAASIMIKLIFSGRDGYTADYLRLTGFKLATPKN